jgi:hemerythrin-like metal-binding protein
MLLWNENLETGHPQVDAEHREIFIQLNEIGDAIARGASREAISRLIVVLLDYSNRHFANEEHAMACAQCPLHGANCAAHRAFIDRMTAWLGAINSGVTPMSLISDVHAEACRWIEHHITTVDLALRPTEVPVACSR